MFSVGEAVTTVYARRPVHTKLLRTGLFATSLWEPLRNEFTTTLLAALFWRLFLTGDVRHGELEQCISPNFTFHWIFEMTHVPFGT